MKTLATCKPTEFLQQTNRIRRYVEKYLKDTNILEVWRKPAELKTAPSNATLEERKRLNAENRELASKQILENLSNVLDIILEERPEETLTLLSLCCFMEPKDVDTHEVAEYLDAAAELIGNQSVLNFFTSVVLLGQISTSAVSKQ